MSSASEPAVEVLTAEIRVLQVGSKPVTLSAARQLDSVDGSAIKPFGRVRIDPKPADGLIAGRSCCGFVPSAARQEGHELFGVAGKLRFCEAGDEVSQRHGLID